MTPTSATGPKGRAGFTLVELLLVLTVLSLAAAAVVLAMPDERPSLAREAERLAARLALARDAAIIDGRAFAVQVDEDGYSFAERREGAWRSLSRPPFESIVWEEDTVAAVPEADAVRIVFDPTGLAEPMAVTLERDGERRTVTLDAAGEVRVAADAAG